MSYLITRPDTDQLKFTSNKTGDWVLEDYLQAAEYGNKSLAELLGQLFDANGDIKNIVISGSVGMVVNNISATEPTTTFVGQVWLQP